MPVQECEKGDKMRLFTWTMIAGIAFVALVAFMGYVIEVFDKQTEQKKESK